MAIETVPTAPPPSALVHEPAGGAQRKPTPAQVAIVCAEIADLAHRLDREFFHGNDTPDFPDEGAIPERTVLFLGRLRDAISYIGWLAELGTQRKIENGPSRWLLPPIFFSGEHAQ